MPGRSSTARTTATPATHRGFLTLVAALTAVVLILTAGEQIYDTNFYSLWEATALLQGDHPYRDFYEWGVLLQAIVSAITQWLSGYRLIGEFGVQWLFIIAGVTIAFALGLRVSRSIVASAGMLVVTLILLAATPTFHYPKLFFYPLGIWIAWRYVDDPTPWRAAAFGLATAAAFLFRHDHGVYLGVAAVLAFVIARITVPGSRTFRSIVRDSSAYAAVAAVVLAPWAVVVQMNEGLPEYVRSRNDLYREWSASDSPYRTLRAFNPLRALMASAAPAAQPRVISLQWDSEIDATRRSELEQELGLQLITGPDADRRCQYRVANIYDARLLRVARYIRDSHDVPWDRLRELSSPLPRREDARLWLEQLTLLVPILLLVSAGLDIARSRRRGEPVDRNTAAIVLAAAFLAIIDSRLFRESSYFVVVTPITAALAARLFPPLSARPSIVAQWLVIAGVMVVTAVAVFVDVRDSGIFNPIRLARYVPETFDQLLSSPPVEAYLPEDEALRYDRAAWDAGEVDKGKVLLRYLHDCTAGGDRVLVTGSTPYQIGYYAERPIAGGHVFWHHRWRSDAAHQRQSLALLERQSVPFAFSTHDPVLEDFKTYPLIRDYLVEHYVELPGTSGLVLVDTRRKATGTFGALGFPCFRNADASHVE